MEKFNYTLSIVAPSKEIADMLMQHICKENIDFIELMKTEQRLKEKIQKEKFLQAISQFEKVIQIIDHCVNDESAIDKIAQLLGIKLQPQI